MKTAGRRAGADPTAAATTVLRRSDWRISLRRVPPPPQAHHCCHCFITSCCCNHRTEEGERRHNCYRPTPRRRPLTPLFYRRGVLVARSSPESSEGRRCIVVRRGRTPETEELTPPLHRTKGGRHGRTRRRRTLLHREEDKCSCCLPLTGEGIIAAIYRRLAPPSLCFDDHRRDPSTPEKGSCCRS
nr:hypothetical protein Iba_scaffold7152CG0010 [Ipomoea batatas]